MVVAVGKIQSLDSNQAGPIGHDQKGPAKRQERSRRPVYPSKNISRKNAVLIYFLPNLKYCENGK